MVFRSLNIATYAIVDTGKGKEFPLSVYMVFPYMDHDLAGLLENERVKLLPSQIKLYMKQLLEGTEYMHRVSALTRFPLGCYDERMHTRRITSSTVT